MALSIEANGFIRYSRQSDLHILGPMPSVETQLPTESSSGIQSAFAVVTISLRY